MPDDPNRLAHRDARAMLQIAVDASPSGMLAVGSDGRILLANEQLCALLGYTPEELIGAQVESLVPHAIRARHVGLRNAYQAHPEPRPMGEGRDLHALASDGRMVPVEIGLRPLDLEGRPVVMVGVLDLTQRREAERRVREVNAQLERRVGERTAALQRSNDDLERFAYVVSHDLREPLRMVANFTQLLEDEYGEQLDDQARSYIAFAVDGARRMQIQLTGLLELSRVNSHGSGFARVSAHRALDWAKQNLVLAIEDVGAEIRHDALPEVWADEVQLSQLFQNLLENALKFHRAQPPCIQVAAIPTEHHVTFTVQDNGLGFDMKHAERVFGVFRRLHAVSAYPGSGIGLALCKRIVERHGGQIWAKSTPGEGTTIEFTLPRHPSQD